jgi:Trk-type K+ transport system membrane component
VGLLTRNIDAPSRARPSALLAPADLEIDRGRGGILAGFLVSLYLLLMLGMFLTLRLPASMPRGNEMNVDRAVFAAVNAGTLTGFQQTIGVGQARRIAQGTALAMTVAASLIVMIVSGMAIVRITSMRYSDRQIVIGAVIAQAIAMILGTGLLLSPGRGPFPSLFDAASAFGNSGLWLGQLPGTRDWQTHAVLLPLAVLGSLGVPVMLDIYYWTLNGRAMSRFSILVLSLSGAAYLIAFAAMVFLPGSGSWIDGVARASLNSVNARTGGLPFLWSNSPARALPWIILLVMFMGGTSGGLAGGLKLTSLFELVRGTRRTLRDEAPGRLFGIASTWLAMYVAIILATLITLICVEPQTPADRLLLLAVSATGNAGLSHDHVASTGVSLFALSGAMLLGRLVPLLMLWWAARRVRDADNAVA